MIQLKEFYPPHQVQILGEPARSGYVVGAQDVTKIQYESGTVLVVRSNRPNLLFGPMGYGVTESELAEPPKRGRPPKKKGPLNEI